MLSPTSRLGLILARGSRNYFQKAPQPLRSKKAKSDKTPPQEFVDLRIVRTVGGNGGHGCISFLQEWCNDMAGPDGGDGGNGGHVILKAGNNVNHLGSLPRVLKADCGEKGSNKDCHGKSSKHTIMEVPIGTVVRNSKGKVIADLNRIGLMFVAARGGAGGKGNSFFTTDTNQAPSVCEFGADGEDIEYTIELRTMAHVGLIGFPNAGKSTLLRAISRARPKVAPYPFTTLKPSIGMVHYDDYEQIAVADLPGLIPDSHKNRGLGIQFLKHAERCKGLLFILDMSLKTPWEQLSTLQYELQQFSEELATRPQLVIANKMDLPESAENLELLRGETDLTVYAISAKTGANLFNILQAIRKLSDENAANKEEVCEKGAT